MLRHYDEIGLLTPESTDKYTGYRYYSEIQLPLAARINALKEMGFGLSVIAKILESYPDPLALRDYLLIQQAELLEQSEVTKQRLILLETAIERLGKDECFMNYEVTVKEIPARTVASVRKIIPTYQDEGMLWKILMEETAPLNLQPAGLKYTLAMFHDGEYKEQDVDVEIQAAISGEYADTANVKFKTAPAVFVASSVYKGSYEQMVLVNQTVADWVVANGYEFAGVNFWIYHVSPHEVETPDDLVTEVCYPIRKKAK